MLRYLPETTHPDLLVGIEHRDDAGVFRLPDGRALVQTIDFFTPVVDDPYAYGQIAAANALSDVYAMGGQPLTVMNVACFDPAAAPPEVWAAVLRGMYDKTVESGAVVLGGHSVEDTEPKFGMSVTGIVDPDRVFANTGALPGDQVFLTKPLGTGIVTTAAKFDAASPEELAAAIAAMSELNTRGRDLGQAANVRCATDITGFGLAGHLFNVARASGVTIEIDSESLPLLPGVMRMISEDHVTGGARKNAAFIGDALEDSAVSAAVRQIVLDPQTSGGLALFSMETLDAPCIGRVVAGPSRIVVR
ncbi:MAG: selenide, water dikinase SelD [Methanoregulaceae archaeon]|nr:selenide, water dikinase SelD [Methanoregulaceae archaeon]